MKFVESTGKKIDDAIKEGLAQLGGLTIDDVDVEILCSGGWLKKAKVRLTVCEEETLDDIKETVKSDIAGATTEEKQPEVKKYTAPKPKTPEKKETSENSDAVKEDKAKNDYKKANDKPSYNNKEKKPAPAVEEKVEKEEAQPPKPVAPEQVELAKNYITKLLEKMGIEATLNVDTSNGAIDVEIVTEDSAVIGHHGEVLDSIQLLTKRAVEEGEDKRLAVHVDCKGYRVQREKTLIAMANRMAIKAIKTGRKVVLEPMNNTQRKVIHATLNDNPKVFTKSEGMEPNRRVVIIPKRNRRRHGGNGYANKPATTAPEQSE